MTFYERRGVVRVHNTHVGIWEEHVDNAGMAFVRDQMLGRLRFRGWKLQRDPKVLKQYPTLADDHWVGRKGDLECEVERRGRSTKVEFFQNLNVSNTKGGRYDFRKLAMMTAASRALRSMCIVELAHVLRKAVELGYTATKVDPANLLSVRDAMEERKPAEPLARFNESWGADRFRRDETGWPAASEFDGYGNRDRDGLPVRNGETRFFRRNGYLMRGVAYTNMNSMWTVYFGGEVTHVSARELFFCDRIDRHVVRRVPGQVERLKMEIVKETKAKRWKRVAAIARALERAEPAAALEAAE